MTRKTTLFKFHDLYAMSGEGFDEKSSDRLEGTRSVVGGLILKQGNNKKTNQSPKKNMLIKTVWW